MIVFRMESPQYSKPSLCESSMWKPVAKAITKMKTTKKTLIKD